MSVQYTKGVNYSSVHWGDVIEHTGGVQYTGGYHEYTGVVQYSGRYHEYSGGYHGECGGYHEYSGGCSIY